MSGTRTSILVSAIVVALLGVVWLAPGDPALAQERATTQKSRKDDRRGGDGGERRDRSDRGERRERRENDHAEEQRSQQRTTASRDARTTPAAPPRREDFAERFAVVYEKNIFLRDRPTYNPSGRAAASTTGPSTFAPKRPEESFVLTLSLIHI